MSDFPGYHLSSNPNEKHRRRMSSRKAELEAKRLSATAQASSETLRELGFLGLARRLLQAKFHHFPAYTNEELAAILDVCSSTQLASLMQRKSMCTGSLFELLSARLRRLEEDEHLPTIIHPEPLEWQS